VCAGPREKIKDILASNSLVMSNLVAERVEILKRLASETEVKIR
jgi:hypothetical protein